MKITEAFKESYNEQSPEAKALLVYTGKIYATQLVSSALRAVIVHAIGRKVAPQIFTSFGRTYVISYLARTLLAKQELTDTQKEEYRELIKAHKETMEKN